MKYHGYIPPVVNVAASAAKRIIEPPMIAQAVMKEVANYLVKHPLPSGAACGVIGNGMIGLAIAEVLLNKGFDVFVYDDNEAAFQGIINKKLYRVDSLEMLTENAVAIFGCTGRDVSKNIASSIVDSASRDKIFFSVSSENREFYSLHVELKRRREHQFDENPFADVIYPCYLNLHMLSGSFLPPANACLWPIEPAITCEPSVRWEQKCSR